MEDVDWDEASDAVLDEFNETIKTAVIDAISAVSGLDESVREDTYFAMYILLKDVFDALGPMTLTEAIDKLL